MSYILEQIVVDLYNDSNNIDNISSITSLPNKQINNILNKYDITPSDDILCNDDKDNNIDIHRPWTKKDIILLMADVDKLTIDELATKYNRSIKSIRARLKKIAYTLFTEENKTINEIKILTGLTEKQILNAIAKYNTK